MFWNCDFLNPAPSPFDALLQAPTVKLSEILYEEDLLQELKTSNISLNNFLSRPEVVGELVDNIANISEQDCSHKLLYSRIHAAYISCEILISGASGIFAASMSDLEFLDKVFSCLVYEPRSPPQDTPPSTTTTPPATSTDITTPNPETETPNPPETTTPLHSSDPTPALDPAPSSNPSPTSTSPIETSPETKASTATDTSKTPTTNDTSIQQPETNGIEEEAKVKEKEEDEEEAKEKEGEISTQQEPAKFSTIDDEPRTLATKVVPQKAALVSKLISIIHSTSPDNVVYYIRQNFETFTKLINLLVNNIDVSGSLEILGTFIKRTTPAGVRDTFSEILLELNLISKLIDAMTLSEFEDKQRNACQLLCDIIVIGRQEASEQHPSIENDILPHDSLIKNLESSEAIKLLLTRMFEGNVRNSTAIICGMKVLQTLLERRSTADPRTYTYNLEQDSQQEIEKRLSHIHALLLNPPKQDPIKTTFGVIQKPLGYMRLEAVNLIRVLISTGLPMIIRKLLELGTLTVIFDLFIEYPWNNLLHTQVEQIISLVIDNGRRQHYSVNHEIGEELYLTERDVILNRHKKSNELPTTNGEDKNADKVAELRVQKSESNSKGENDNHIPLQAEQHDNNISSDDKPNLNGTETNDENNQKAKQEEDGIEEEDQERKMEIEYSMMMEGQEPTIDFQTEQGRKFLKKKALKKAQSIILEAPLKALLIQLLEECDLIERLLMPTNFNGTNGVSNNSNQLTENHNNNHLDSENEEAFNSTDNKLALIRGRQGRDTGEQANFGHIIQIINAISINRDIYSVEYHLSIMSRNRPELFERWNNFVNQDVLSFKSCVLFYDSSTNSIGYRLIEKPKMNKNLTRMPKNIDSITINQLNEVKDKEWDGNRNSYTSRSERVFYNFKIDQIVPKINRNVLPRTFSNSLLPDL